MGAKSIDTQTGLTTTYYQDGQGDVIGGANFDIYGMQVDFSNGGNTVQVRIDSPYFTFWQQGGTYEPGDLFLSTDGWQANGTKANHYQYDHSGAATLNGGGNGENWEYVIDLAGLLGEDGTTRKGSGSASLYALGSYSLGDRRVAGGTERTIQEVSFFQGANDIPLSTKGSWWINANSMTIPMDISSWYKQGLWRYDQINLLGLHHTMTCANDIMEGMAQTAPVPEPATMLLLAAGLAGLAGAARLRK